MSEPNARRPYMPGYGIVGPGEGRGLLPWSWAEERLIASHDYWVATVWPDGRPHVMPSSTIAVVDGSDLRVSEMAVAWSGVGRELRLSIYPLPTGWWPAGST